MNKKAFKILEFDKIVEQLSGHADSEPGRQLCLKISPKTDIKQIRLYQQQTGDALGRLLKNGSTSFGNNKDVSYITKHLSIGGSLNADELLLLAGLLENTSRVKQYGRTGNPINDGSGHIQNNLQDGNGQSSDAGQDSLTGFFDELEPLTPLSTEVRRCILASDEFADDASPALKDIRRKIAATGDKDRKSVV